MRNITTETVLLWGTAIVIKWMHLHQHLTQPVIT